MTGIYVVLLSSILSINHALLTGTPEMYQSFGRCSGNDFEGNFVPNIDMSQCERMCHEDRNCASVEWRLTHDVTQFWSSCTLKSAVCAQNGTGPVSGNDHYMIKVKSALKHFLVTRNVNCPLHDLRECMVMFDAECAIKCWLDEKCKSAVYWNEHCYLKDFTCKDGDGLEHAKLENNKRTETVYYAKLEVQS